MNLTREVLNNSACGGLSLPCSLQAADEGPQGAVRRVQGTPSLGGQNPAANSDDT